MIPEFRVWSEDLSKYRKLDDFSNDQGLGMFFEVQKGIGSNVTSICYPINDVVEQFTGLTDVNGKDIYEGDIVRIDDYETVAVRYGTQDHEEEYGDHFMYKGWNVNLGGGYPDATMNDLKILGNIHENPELLEVEK